MSLVGGHFKNTIVAIVLLPRIRKEPVRIEMDVVIKPTKNTKNTGRPREAVEFLVVMT